jgi:hypothetical protein
VVVYQPVLVRMAILNELQPAPAAEFRLLIMVLEMLARPPATILRGPCDDWPDHAPV